MKLKAFLSLTFLLAAAQAGPLFFHSFNNPEKVTSPVERYPTKPCPGGKAECPEDFTCCKLTAGKWGCCPLKEAVCCSDGVHCCPKGYQCHSGDCQKVADMKPLLRLDPLQHKENRKPDDSPSKTKIEKLLVKNVRCPDRLSQCPDHNTCCKMTSGSYGCCPVYNATCCSDGLHCCPSGYKCDPSGGYCVKSFQETSLAKRISANSAEGNVVCPDGASECPTGNTCCKLKSGEYGCCPLPNAVCCSDGEHCCPNGYTCSTGTCSKGAEKIAWLTKTEAMSTNVVCPGGASECPTGNTCCKLKSGEYGCCPVPHAVCCSDGVHCCPNGYTCSGGMCSKGAEKIAWLTKMEAMSTNVVCPGGASECPTGNTCCKLKSGEYGCCPVPHAVCCSDGVHCCPNGYTCSGGMCTKGTEKIAWLTKMEAMSTNVVCPDGTSECPSGNTCCKLKSGTYGCCPLPNAVCCSDGEHCCPNGYTCSSGTCSKGADKIAWLTKTEAISTNVVCPGGASECPTGNTCCKLKSGEYGCCPVPHAVCCSDGLHCCPNGYTCSDGMCTKGAEKIAWLAKTEARSTNVVCPGGASECPTGNTCCKLKSGTYGCCPVPHAVCCSDGLHCCPNGYTCSGGMCTKGAEKIAWLTKTEAMSRNVVCPGGASECPTGNTCCKLKSGEYGCCPVPHAVCCSDGVHCCPNGYTCSGGMCTKGAEKIAWLTKTEARSTNVVCPGGASECPTGNTCCKLKSGEYGCCPVPHAVCCSDGLHCCPNGYTCSGGMCTKGAEKIAWLKKTEAMSTNVVCPGGASECPTGNTCCRLKSGEYGCCPVPHAVCCSDGLHCCPNGYTCSGGMCTKGAEKIAWLTKTEGISRGANIYCPDRTYKCPTGNTCCKLKTGSYGCCPLPKAACCNDGIHCCPNGFKCQQSTGRCVRGTLSIVWLTKTDAVSAMSKNVVCPGGTSECPTGNTCCKLKSGEYGCCPVPHAVCCSDRLHCCPNGYTCSSGMCSKGAEKIAWLTKTEAMSTNVVCPGGASECPTGNTCCKLKSGEYGCCPLPNAVCCTDGEHCCPNGYTCESGSCMQATERIAWVMKTDAIRRRLCPGGKVTCETGTTCCLMSDGAFGCCPTPNAVCCKDHIHCCPAGATCDTKLERCVSKDGILPLLTKVKAISVSFCNATKSPCQKDQTCCDMKGAFSCCPFQKAVCCSDRLHCCPPDHTCDVKAKKCIKKSMSPFVAARSEEKPKPLLQPRNRPVMCPDGVSFCSEGYTCCAAPMKRWACCPLPKAVCCADKIHCCPAGYSCNTYTTKCDRKDAPSVAMVKKTAPMLQQPSRDCGGRVECPNRNTCCMMKSGEPGCCPVHNAICCRDGLHCCPQGTVCAERDRKCLKKDGKHAMPFAIKGKLDRQTVGIMCSQDWQCLDNQTCCHGDGREEWRCCPGRKATCCKDNIHCCPHDYICDMEKRDCRRKDDILTWR